jgi:hypothetical protein
VAEPTVTAKAASRTEEPAKPGRGSGAPPAAAPRSAREQWVRLGPYVILFGAVALVIAGQVAEDLADSEPIQLLTPLSALRRWTLIVAVGYMLAISLVIDRLVLQSLTALDRLVRIRPDRFRDYTNRMHQPDVGINFILLVVAGLIVVFLFLGLRTSLPIDDGVTSGPTFLPGGGLSAAVVLIQYALVGWAILALVWTTVRRARALGRLSREPLHVDVFDTSNVLPLGNIALANALAPAGVVIILVFGFGAPRQPGSWAVLVLVSLASLVALLLPLRGIHGQMENAKDKALGDINRRLRDSYEELKGIDDGPPEAVSSLRNRVGALMDLRRTVTEMPTWPFRDTLAFGRAVLIALAPLIYTVFNELVKTFVVGPLTR